MSMPAGTLNMSEPYQVEFGPNGDLFVVAYSRLMRFDVISLFPESYPGPLGVSIPGRAIEEGRAEIFAHDLPLPSIIRLQQTSETIPHKDIIPQSYQPIQKLWSILG